MRSLALSIVLVFAAGLGACHLPLVVGSIECRSNADCAPPGSLCGVDARCVDGCVLAGCVAGASCAPATGACTGDIFGTSCAGDTSCDAPEVVCNAATSTCAASCVLTGTCPTGLACDRSSGRCCDPDEHGCRATGDAPHGCQDDDDCGAPAHVCQANECVPGCATTACSGALSCDPASGHCSPSACQRDSDCDDSSTCTQLHTCVPLKLRGYGSCSGGSKVDFSCAAKSSAASFVGCSGAGGPATCPYCIDDSCFAPGLCSTSADCSAGLGCSAGLCVAQAPQCPTLVELTDVVNGRYHAGKAICVRAKVTSVRSGYDGAVEVRLGTSPYLYVDVLEMYEQAGVKVPTVGDTVTVHGTLRWDEDHGDRELLPVDWIGP